MLCEQWTLKTNNRWSRSEIRNRLFTLVSEPKSFRSIPLLNLSEREAKERSGTPGMKEDWCCLHALCKLGLNQFQMCDWTFTTKKCSIPLRGESRKITACGSSNPFYSMTDQLRWNCNSNGSWWHDKWSFLFQKSADWTTEKDNHLFMELKVGFVLQLKGNGKQWG